MLTLTMAAPVRSPLDLIKNHQFRLDSSLQELYLYDFHLEDSHLGIEATKTFEVNPMLPGVILTHKGNFSGMISRQRFWERMGRPYALELFLKRPLKALYDFTQTELTVFPQTTTIVEAARRSLERSPEFLYEPIVVEVGEQDYRLLDIHQLLLAQSKIHQLTSQLLDESTYAQRVQTEKMVSLGRMVAGVAHEIRNPVNSVNGNIEFLSDYYQNLIDLLALYQEHFSAKCPEIIYLEEEIDLEFILEDSPRLLKSMKIGSERLIQIVTSLRNFSRLDDNDRQTIDIHECIDSTLLILENRIKRTVEVIKNYEQLPQIDCYSGQLSQVFMNLITNAIDAMMDKKEEDTEYKPQLTITTSLTKNSQNMSAILIKIADNATGIPPEIQARIFENFFTTKPIGKGTGLGLAISHQIVTEKHQGELTFNSEVGLGTTFAITLPLLRSTST